jgi:hypothetical protein
MEDAANGDRIISLEERQHDMQQNQHKSEVARTRANIEAECEALRHFLLFSHSGSHAIISARFQALDAYHQELCMVMPEQEATSLMTAIYTEVVQ